MTGKQTVLTVPMNLPHVVRTALWPTGAVRGPAVTQTGVFSARVELDGYYSRMVRAVEMWMSVLQHTAPVASCALIHQALIPVSVFEVTSSTMAPTVE